VNAIFVVMSFNLNECTVYESTQNFDWNKYGNNNERSNPKIHFTDDIKLNVMERNCIK
jgi:hypothetical protein